MSLLLLLLGLLVTAAGFVAIGFGLPINAFSIGNTLIIAGTTAAAGGLVLIGLAAVVGQLQRVVARLAAQPARQPARAPATGNPMVPPTARMSSSPTANPVKPAEASASRQAEARPPEPRPSEYRAPEPRPYEARSSAPPRLAESRAAETRATETRAPETRSSQPSPPPLQRSETTPPLSPDSRGPLSWLRAKPRFSPPGDEPSRSSAEIAAEAPSRNVLSSEPAEPKGWSPSREEDVTGIPTEPAPTPLPEPSDRVAPSPEGPKDSGLFDVDWPVKTGPASAADSDKRDQSPSYFTRMRRESPAAESQNAPPMPAAERITPAILKSGVIDGMAYTLYADGSIEAELPQGTLTFASVDALRIHLEMHGG